MRRQSCAEDGRSAGAMRTTETAAQDEQPVSQYRAVLKRRTVGEAHGSRSTSRCRCRCLVGRFVDDLLVLEKKRMPLRGHHSDRSAANESPCCSTPHTAAMRPQEYVLACGCLPCSQGYPSITTLVICVPRRDGTACLAIPATITAHAEQLYANDYNCGFLRQYTMIIVYC